jgi:hypothetical protein
MKARAILFGILTALLVLIFTLVVPAGDMRADTGCDAKINGVDVMHLSTPGNALEVQKDEILVVTFQTSSPITSHNIKIYNTDVRAFWTITETNESSELDYVTTVDVAKYARFGLGLYKITAEATQEGGYTCSATAYIRVVGGSFLETVLGPIALALSIFGALGLLLCILIAWAHPERLPCCGPILPLAVALTMMAMLTGGAPGSSSGDSQTNGSGNTPEVPSGSKGASGGGKKYRLRLLIPAVGCALLSAIGFLLLFQQMGTVYPTIIIVVLSLVLALVAGIILPLLAMKFSRQRK